ncbi:MAG: DMT family transporter [Lachnospiraceae bacterium]|nr:DMT family transporter [Lachnospiraceae bacterium]
MKKSSFWFALLQLFGALIWGLAFAFQSMGMETVGPFTFSAVRFAMAAVVVFAFSFVHDRFGNTGKNPKACSWKNAKLWRAGITIGILLSLASNLQQIGILKTDSVGKAGFITAMYIVIVPVLGLFLKRKPGINVWIGIVLAVCGLYFLTMSGSLTVTSGDIYLIGCAVVFALQILAIDVFAGEYDSVKLACIEFLTVTVTSAVFMFALEDVTMSSILAAGIPLLYAGVLSGGIAYTIQIICQSRIEPSVASILMSAEALFSVLGGFLILHQKLTSREMLGSILMFAAIMIVQTVPGRKRKQK